MRITMLFISINLCRHERNDAKSENDHITLMSDFITLISICFIQTYSTWNTFFWTQTHDNSSANKTSLGYVNVKGTFHRIILQTLWNVNLECSLNVLIQEVTFKKHQTNIKLKRVRKETLHYRCINNVFVRVFWEHY